MRVEREAVRRGAVLLAAAVVASGCARYGSVAGSWHMPPGAEVAMLLAAGSEEAPEELVEFYEHDGEKLIPRDEPLFPKAARAQPPPRRKPPRIVRLPPPEREKGSQFGVRAGYLMVEDATYAWPQALYGGLFTKLGSGKAAIEFGGEYASLKTEDEGKETDMVFLRADLVLGIGRVLHFVLGGQAILETPKFNTSEDLIIGGGAGVGLGVQLGKLDIRGVYHMVLSDDPNTESYLGVTAGVGF